MYLHSADRWWSSSSVALYHQQTNHSQQAIEQSKFIQKVVSPDVSNSNHAAMNKKQDKKQFSLEKNGFVTLANPSYRSMDCDIK